MKKTHHGPIVTVRNYGPIARAELELHPVTILTGPTNTGKSTLLHVLQHATKAVRARANDRMSPIYPIPATAATRIHIQAPTPPAGKPLKKQRLPTDDSVTTNPFIGAAAAYGNLGWPIFNLESNHTENLRDIHRRIDQQQPQKSPPVTPCYLNIAEAIEKAMGGTVTKYPYYGFQPHGTKKPIPTFASSHTAQTLVPLIFHLREFAKPGQVLHLDGILDSIDQTVAVEVALQLVRLSQQYIHVRLCTHSDMILERLSTLHWFSQLSRKKHRTISTQCDAGHISRRWQELDLHNARIGCWSLNPTKRKSNQTPRQSILRQYIIDKESAMYVRPEDTLALDLYNEWVAIDQSTIS